MAMPTTRISKATHKLLQRLSEEEGTSMQSIIENALEEYRRNKFIEKSNEAYMELRQREEDWAQEKEERETWDKTLQDGFEKDARE